MRKLNTVLFVVICFCFSAAMLVGALFGAIRLAEVNSTIAETEKQITFFSEENELLKIKAINKISIQKIDEYAREVLHMQTASAQQIYIIELSDNQA